MGSISQNQNMQLLGLKTLAIRYIQQLDEIEVAVREITREAADSYHATDLIYADMSLKQMLKNLRISVEPS